MLSAIGFSIYRRETSEAPHLALALLVREKTKRKQRFINIF